MQENSKGLNISHKYKFQWIAPERTGSRKVAQILCYFGFVQNNLNIFSHNEYNYIHSVFFDKKYSDYKIICNARNPYGRTLSIFRNLYGQEYRNGTKEQFRRYVFEDLKRGQTLEMVKRPEIDKKIDYIIRLENLTEDLSKIPFVLEKFTSKQLEDLASHGKPLLNWEEFYDEEIKDEVYRYTKHLFDMWGYEK